MRVHTRLGLSFCFTVFSLVTITLLLPNSRVGTQLQKIALGTSVNELWNWVSDDNDGVKDGMRLVVFGDSWVDDTIQAGGEGKGKGWTEVLCHEIKCTTYLNFADSQPSKSFPELSPSGAMISNDLYTSSVTTFSPSQISPMSLLLDLAAQIEEFLKLPPSFSDSAETIFVVSFGVWDIYHFAGLDFTLGKNITGDAVSELFSHLDKLHAHYIKDKQPTSSNSGNTTDNGSATFRVIIPKLFEPTLLPGWITQRPVPLPPSSVAEQQKNGMYLTNLWNSKLENKIGEWLQNDKFHSTPSKNEGNDANKTPGPPLSSATKDVFYYDLPRYILNALVEHQLEDEGLSDASGLGKGESPFESVSVPCVRDGEEGEQDGYVDQNGRLVCKEPEEYLFWDNFNLGAVANEAMGKEVGEMVKEGKTMKKVWAEGKPSPSKQPTRLKHPTRLKQLTS